MTQATLGRQSTSDRVREILMDRILDGTYAPGDRIVELDVSKELGTSQAPVREALRELQGLRLVEVRPYKGARVREVSDEEVRESFEVRSVLEAFAAELAAQRLSQDVGPLQSALEAMRAAVDPRDCDAFVAADLAFHRAVVSGAKHGTLLNLWESVGVEVWMRVLLKRSKLDLGPVAEAHVPIVAAFGGGNGEEAARLLRGHPATVYDLWSKKQAGG